MLIVNSVITNSVAANSNPQVRKMQTTCSLAHRDECGMRIALRSSVSFKSITISIDIKTWVFDF